MPDAESAFRVDRANGVLALSFDRPDMGNALPQEAVAGLTEVFRSLNRDPAIRAMLVRGEGRHFCSGGDVAGFMRSLDQPVPQRQADFARRLEAVGCLVEAYLAVEVPIVVACQGTVAGAGLLYPLGADYVLADETAVFRFSHQRVGLTPDGGVSLLLPRVVGMRRARELVLTAASVDSAEALHFGIVSRIVAAAALQDEAMRQAARFAAAPVEVLRTAKRLLGRAGAVSDANQLLAEREAIVASVGHPDFAEGVRAFVDKRIAVFPSTQ